MRNRGAILLLGLFCISAGCETYHYQEGKTFAECKKDREDCFTELKKRADWEIPGSYERDYMESCLKRKGYRLVKEKELPFDVKRQDPASTIYGRVYEAGRGIAGTVDSK
jgi:hypothetical protein